MGTVIVCSTTSQDVADLLVLADAINDKMIMSDQEKEWHKNKNRNGIIPDDGSPRPVALTTVEALDASAAWDLSQRRIRFILDCANFALNAATPIDMVFQLSDAPLVQPPATGLAVDITTNGMLQKQGEVAGPWNLVYEHFKMATAETHWIKPLFDMLSLPNWNKHQIRILNAVYWAGRALTRHRMEEKFLFQAIALESLMLPQNDAEITNRLALCVVHPLGDWLRDRNWCFKDIKRLYAVRSKIVHSGVYEVQPTDVVNIRAYLQGCIERLLTDARFRQMSEESDLDKWLWASLRGEDVTQAGE